MEFRIDRGRVGISQRTPDGFLRCYMRLAVADRPYTYRNVDGGVRQEIISADELFRKDSADTFKMLPVTLGHPSCRVVTPDNATQFMKGATGHTVGREKTADGEFLGIVASVFDRETIDAIESGWQISPGYRVQTRLRGDGMYSQHNRNGNHASVVKVARGGADVLPILNGISLDGADELDIWHVNDSDVSDLFAAEFDRELILPVLESANFDGVAQRMQIDLDRYKRPSVNSAALPGGACEKCEKTDKKKSMTSITISGVTYEVEPALAQALAPHLERSDSLDAVLDANEELESALEAAVVERDAEDDEDLAALEEELDDLLTEEDELDDDAQTDSAFELEFMTDEAEGEGYSEAQLQLNIDAVNAVSQLMADAAFVVDSGAELTPDAHAILSNMTPEIALRNLDDIQQLIIESVNPDMAVVIDGLDDEQVSAAYDATLAMFRKAVASRADEGSSRNDMGYDQPHGFGHSGMHSYRSVYTAKRRKGGGKKKADVRTALKLFRKQQADAFEQAGEMLKSGKSSASIIL